MFGKSFLHALEPSDRFGKFADLGVTATDLIKRVRHISALRMIFDNGAIMQTRIGKIAVETINLCVAKMFVVAEFRCGFAEIFCADFQ